jgi:4-amino-4-deoxychorismate lyase
LYSSFVDGVVTDPLLMTVPIDDHFVHRGHAVFDTATVANGYIYRLDVHLDRFITSAKLAKLKV